MDACEITQEQIKLLANGETIHVRYKTVEEYGQILDQQLDIRPKGHTGTIKTRDGHTLLVGHAYWNISFEEDSFYVDSSTKCVYEGSFTRENQQFPHSLPPDCSGAPMQRFEEIHRFRDVSDPHKGYDLTSGEIKDSIMGNPCNVEEVTRFVLKV